MTKPTGAKQIKPVPEQPDRYEIPIQMKVEKKVAFALERKACQFRLPVKLERSEKIRISNYSYNLRVDAEKGSKIKSSLEVFLASKRGKPLITEIKALDKNEQMTKAVSFSEIVDESECGSDVIVAGNLSVVTMGIAKASVATDPLYITLQIVKCN